MPDSDTPSVMLQLQYQIVITGNSDARPANFARSAGDSSLVLTSVSSIFRVDAVNHGSLFIIEMKYIHRRKWHYEIKSYITDATKLIVLKVWVIFDVSLQFGNLQFHYILYDIYGRSLTIFSDILE